MASDRPFRICRPILMLAVLAAALLVATPRTRGQEAQGTIRGAVFDADFQVPVSGVRVQVLEANRSTRTDETGSFTIANIPPGTYTLTFSRSGYDRRILGGVVLAPGQVRDTGVVELAPEVIDMPQLIVTGDDLLAGTELMLLEIRAEAMTLQDNISSELLSKAGVSDVAGALKLVTGTTVRDGKYATVRGLSDRYTGTTVNGVRVPSADPRYRAVQVDLFPTAMVESIVVTKTFLPDLLGEFSGGGVDIRTKQIPDSLLFKVSVSGEHDSLASHNPRFLTYEGGGVDSFGFDANDRALSMQPPSEPLPTTRNPGEEDIAVAQQWDDFANSFAPAMGTVRERPELGNGFSISAGNRFQVWGGRKAGLSGAFVYSNKYRYFEDGENNLAEINGAGQPLDVQSRSYSVGTEELLMGLLANAAIELDESNSLALKVVANHSAEDEARLEITPQGTTREQQNQALRYTERVLTSAQLHGEHDLPGWTGFEFNWVVALNSTSQEEPDVRFFRNQFFKDRLSFDFPGDGSSLSEKTRRTFREIAEDGFIAKLDGAYAFEAWGRDAELKGGLYFDTTDRSLEQDSFTYRSAPVLCRLSRIWCRRYRAERYDDSAADLDSLWTDNFTDSNSIGFPDPETFEAYPDLPPTQFGRYPTSLFSDVNYDGEQEVTAAYAMLELPLTDSITITAGARFETTDISITPSADTDDDTCPPESIDPTCSRPGQLEVAITQISENPETGEISVTRGLAQIWVASGEGDTDIDETDLLPAISAVWDMTPEMKLRASWAKTIARPTFRELSPVATIEALQGDEFIGNPALMLSRITNYDLRWEWFPRAGDLLALSVFHKDLEDPIEYVGFGVSSRSFVFPQNFEKGQVTGFEFEGRLGLSRLREWSWFDGWGFLDHMTVGANFTSLDSTVDLPELELAELAGFEIDITERALQGQPDFLINSFITYENDAIGTTLSLFYNQSGETLDSGFGRTFDFLRPDVFETPSTSLTFKGTQSVRDDMDVSLKVSNITRDDKETIYRYPDGSEEAIKTLHETGLRVSVSLSYSWK